MDDCICLGDVICLYCEESDGYVFNVNSSTAHNTLLTYNNQPRDKPLDIPNPHAISFEVCAKNSYKLNKEYRKAVEASKKTSAECDNRIQQKVTLAKIKAEAETNDNIQEQKRRRGRHLHYGQVIQLRHVFSARYIHVSTTFTSPRGKNKMMVHLDENNGKTAQFKILPRYKVKAEGDLVQVNDRIILESVKSPGQYLHSSAPWSDARAVSMCEVNLGVHPSGFTAVLSYKPDGDGINNVRGGAVVRLYHKELEAYLAAEGVFQNDITENVHLRLRPLDLSKKAKRMRPPTSAITFWQVEFEQSITDGSTVQWEQQIRLRHFSTRQYLSVSPSGQIGLTDQGSSPTTVFRLLPVTKEGEDVVFETFSRIQHELSGLWLHALKGDEYKKKDQSTTSNIMRQDGASLVKIGVVPECMYDDAFTIQEVKPESIQDFNYVAGAVPVVADMIQDIDAGKTFNLKQTTRIVKAMKGLANFQIVNGEAWKDRQKLLRNVRLIDLLVEFIMRVQRKGIKDISVERICTSIYEVLTTYLLGDSRKNKLYFAKYLEFFRTQLDAQGETGLKMTVMITELIRDNRKIVDRITRQDIDGFVKLVKEKNNYRYLELLSVLCVCDGIALPDNQTYITQKWLEEDKGVGVFLTEFGGHIKQDQDNVYVTNKVYVSKTRGKSWIPLHTFVDLENPEATPDEYMFLEHQLDLFGKLCYGRNYYAIKIITQELKYLSWEEAFSCLTGNHLPNKLRAKYCDLVIGLFIDVGTNRDVLYHLNLSFVYDDVHPSSGTKKSKNGEMMNEETMTIFPKIRDWMANFLGQNKHMTASEVGHNMLIEQVLRMLYLLVKFGYYGEAQYVDQLIEPLLSLLDGCNDKPYLKETELVTMAGPMMKSLEDSVAHYRKSARFKQCPQNKAIVDAKYRAMEVVELLMNLQFTQRLEKFVSLFKSTHINRKSNELSALMQEKANVLGNKNPHGLQRKALKELKTIFDQTDYFDADEFTKILLDLSHYEYDKMVTKSMSLLLKYHSAKGDMFEKVVQAQVLLTPKSVVVYQMIEAKISMLKRLTKTKIGPEQAQSVCPVLAEFAELCHMENEPDERHPVNQQILVNFDILSVIRNILQQGIDAEIMTSSDSTRQVLQSTLVLLRYLAKGYKHVQLELFSYIDTLLSVKGVGGAMANALIEVFTGNQTTCLKVRPGQIQKIVQLAADNQKEAAEFIDLLCAIVKIEDLNLPLKRNQGYVMKYIMQNYHTVAYVLDKSREDRMRILIGHEGPKHQSYLISLVDLLATCSEGENQFIESLCHTIYSLDDILYVLNDCNIDNNFKRPYLRFLLWVYLDSEGIDADIMDLANKCMPLFRELVHHAEQLTYYIKQSPSNTALLLKKALPKSTVDQKDCGPDCFSEEKAFTTLHYFFDAALPFVEIFYKKGYIASAGADMKNVTDSLATALVGLSDAVAPLISINNQMKILIRSVTAILRVSNLSVDVVEVFLARHGGGELKSVMNPAQEAYYEMYTEEMTLNHVLNVFAVNYSIAFKGENTTLEQIGYATNKPYTEVGGDEDLPLGEEFQQLVKWFTKKSDDTHHYASKLVQQLDISANHMKEFERNKPEQVLVDIRCLQVLRAILHNEMIKLPDSPKQSKKAAYERQLAEIHRIQESLNSHGAITKTMPMIERHNDAIVREYLAFLAVMLFDANKTSQDSLEDYFLTTREEMFFSAVKNRIEMSVLATKEKRFLLAQFAARQEEAEAQTLALEASLTCKKKALQAYSKQEQRYCGFDITVSLNSEMKTPDKENGSGKKKNEKSGKGKSKSQSYQNAGFMLTEEVEDGLPTFTDDGYMELMLRVMAGMCDGQNKVLQDYLREQPDNFKSFNLVAKVTTFLNVLYSHISGVNVQQITQLFSTLVEFASGNPTNHHVIYDNNIVDYINFILRSDKHEDVTDDQMLELHEAIGRLLLIMLEENRPETGTLMQEMKGTIDIESLQKFATQSYATSMKSMTHKEDYLSVGFIYYFVLMRLKDLEMDKKPLRGFGKTDEDVQANNFYNSSCKSVEIMKDQQIHRMYFRVKDQKILREEVKERMKWNVDRSSSSNKLRELMEWSKSIIDDIYYQRKIQKCYVASFLIKYWNLWNDIVILLSVIINIMMLVTWDSKMSLTDTFVTDGGYDTCTERDQNLPSDIYSAEPVMDDWYKYVFWPLAILHNLFSVVVLISYCLSSRPRVPNRTTVTKWWSRRTFGGIRKPPSTRHQRPDHLRIELFSFQSIYFILFAVFSGLGTASYGYFFAFHLLDIVNRSDMLQRVILAVTQNGKSLLWVSVLGIIIIYIFALFSFAFFRGSMNEAGEDSTLYCRNLWQCLVTVTRFGLIGDMFEKMQVFRSERSFEQFSLQSLFHLLFFIVITTIGLNIIFGIILDTFSELRNLKWTAGMDMRNTCFICSLGSFEFESHGKGFEHHTRHDHNMWAYILFFIHLEETSDNDFTNLEMHVSKQIAGGRLDFFPVYRALILKEQDKAKTDTKMDEVLIKLNKIMARQRTDDIEKSRQQERDRQNAWEEQHRAVLHADHEESDSEKGTQL